MLSNSGHTEAELLQLAVFIENMLKNVPYSMSVHQKEAELHCSLLVTENEVELLQLSVVIENMLKNVTYRMFDHQKEAELLCLVLVTRMRMNCLHFLWSLEICRIMLSFLCLVIRKMLNCFA